MKRYGALAFAQSMIEYAEDLITASPKESFSRVDILVLLNAIKNDRELVTRLNQFENAVTVTGFPRDPQPRHS